MLPPYNFMGVLCINSMIYMLAKLKKNYFNYGKHILFILKEAYGGEDDWSLSEEVKKNAPWSAVWNRIVEWTYGISLTTVNTIARYEPSKISLEKPNPWLNQIAVLNIKKSSGKSQSYYGEIAAYADYDSAEIIRQIEIIDPDIIVCGATFGDVNTIMRNPCKKRGMR